LTHVHRHFINSHHANLKSPQAEVTAISTNLPLEDECYHYNDKLRILPWHLREHSPARSSYCLTRIVWKFVHCCDRGKHHGNRENQ
jgi:hypothetical protein